MTVALDLLPVDPLGDALHVLRMRGAFYSRSEFTAPWGVERCRQFPDYLMFHVVTAGRCWLEVDGAQPLWSSPAISGSSRTAKVTGWSARPGAR